MKDGPGRRAVKAVARWVTAINLYATRGFLRAVGKRPYRLGGECRKCAACCENPGIQVGILIWYFPTLRRFFLWWQRKVNGFELTHRDIRHKVLYFRCTHFDTETRRCDSYGSRPLMCRDYPRLLLWHPNPAFLPGCGYRAVKCGAEKFIEALQREGIEGEELERLKDKLHLRE